VVFNGQLSAYAGPLPTLLIIHVIGTLAMALVLLLSRENPLHKPLKPLLYIGGLLGLLTTLFNNLAFGRISVSAMLALALLGDSLTSIAADHFGVLGMPCRPFRRQKLWGLLFTLLGIAIMLDSFELVPVLCSLAAGLTVATSRLTNGELARQTSVRISTFFNYLIGLLGAALVVLLTGSGMPAAQAFSGPPAGYLGAVLGVTVVLISNLVIGRIAIFEMSLAIFVGQVFMGVVMDVILSAVFPLRSLLGGLFALLGLIWNLWVDRKLAAGGHTEEKPGLKNQVQPVATLEESFAELIISLNFFSNNSSGVL
jgi:transporter family-2 protein